MGRAGAASHMGFSCEGQPNFFGGINQTLFLIGGLEVFTISEIAAVPEMSTWAMMILVFAGLGVMAWRRQDRDFSNPKLQHSGVTRWS